MVSALPYRSMRPRRTISPVFARMIQSVQMPEEVSHVVSLPSRTRQSETERFRLMASERARLIAPTMSIRLCRESIVDRHRSEGRDCDAEDDAGHGDRDDQLEQRESRIARSSLDFSSPQIHDFAYGADTIAHFDQMRRRNQYEVKVQT